MPLVGVALVASCAAERSEPKTDADRLTETATNANDETSQTTGPGPAELAFEPIALGGLMVRATALAFLPERSQLLLLSKDGDVGHFELDGDEATWLGGFTLPAVHRESDCGAISLAVDPDFASNRFFYVGLCQSETHSAIVRLALPPEPEYEAVPASMSEIIVVGHPDAQRSWHNIGSIGFDRAGYLWAIFGDKTVGSSAQDLGSNLGSIIRIVPDRTPDGSGYAGAPDNPFFGDDERSWDIWAYGLRSPWTAVLDQHGRYFVGDVGSDRFEEINLVARAGVDLGWPTYEGACDAADCSGVVDPVVSWPHDAHGYIDDDPLAEPANARVAWVAAAYAAGDNDRYDGLLTDRVLFGDSCIGYVRGLEVDGRGEIVFDEHLGHLVAPTGWAQGPDGYLYVVTYGGCGSGSIDANDPPPAELFRVTLAR